MHRKTTQEPAAFSAACVLLASLLVVYAPLIVKACKTQPQNPEQTARSVGW